MAAIKWLERGVDKYPFAGTVVLHAKDPSEASNSRI